MAEGLARHLGGERVAASSAGVYPASIVQPETFQVMAECGMPLDPAQIPRSILMIDGAAVDLLIDMSGQPVTRLLRNFEGRQIDWDVPDPIGTNLQNYRAVRDLIEQKVRALIKEATEERR